MISEYEKYYKAYKHVCAGKMGEWNQMAYRYYLEANLFDIRNSLLDKTFTPDAFRIKALYVPKYRIAQVPSVNDKIVQHLICDNYAYDALTKPFIRSTTATIKNRGTDDARNILKTQLRSFWSKYKRKPYILKCDIHHYFNSISHDRVIRLIDKYVADDDIKWVMVQFVNMTDMGLPLGLQQSQILANLYLSELDHITMDKFHFKYYGRHMDDFYIISDDRKKLERYYRWLVKYVNSIGLSLNPKTKITYGKFDYLGFNFRLTDTGKVVMRIATSKIKQKRRHLKLMIKQLDNGEIITKQFEDKYFSYRQHLLKGDTRSLARSLDNYLNEKLHDIGYGLAIKKHPNGKKIKWRVHVYRVKEEKREICQE